jgi:hypothetical protein
MISYNETLFKIKLVYTGFAFVLFWLFNLSILQPQMFVFIQWYDHVYRQLLFVMTRSGDVMVRVLISMFLLL